MALQNSLESLCSIDLYGNASKGNSAAMDVLKQAWEVGGNQVSDRETYCIIPCLLAHCGVKISLDLSVDPVALRDEVDTTNALTGICTRKNVLLDTLGLNARAENWSEYDEYDIRPSDPGYMDI